MILPLQQKEFSFFEDAINYIQKKQGIYWQRFLISMVFYSS